MSSRPRSDVSSNTEEHKADGTWANGRRLTNAQREKKREKNRESRKDARHRESARIAHMEAELRSLRAILADISMPIEKMTAEFPVPVTQLAIPRPPTDSNSSPSSWNEGFVGGPESQLLGFGEAAFAPPASSLTSSPPQTQTHTSPHEEYGSLPYSENLNRGIVPAEAVYSFGGASSLPAHTVPNFLEPAHRPPLLAPQSLNGALVPTVPRLHKTTFLNEICSRSTTLDLTQVCTDEASNEDFLAKAILYGWDAAFQTWYRTCPLWSLLRCLDDVLLGECESPISRLGILWCVHIMSMSVLFGKTGAKHEPPPWYRPRPAQQLIEHDVVADYIVWPGMRERVVLYGTQVCLTNEFWTTFHKSFCFQWPGHLTEAFQISPESGQHRFTGHLINCLQDINYWRLDLSFFDKFPAFVDDVIPAQTIPPQINSWNIHMIPRVRSQMGLRSGDHMTIRSSNELQQIKYEKSRAHSEEEEA